MTEIWLQSNRRVLLLALAPIGLLAAAGAAALALSDAWIARVFGGALTVAAAALCVGVIHQLRHPRITFDRGEVMFHLRAGRPVAVPVEIIEAFFLGQGPALLPPIKGQQPETVNLVARLSQKAPEWSHVDVKPALGRWCDSYVTIRGTWCEPLTGEAIRRLNRRLREVHEAQLAAVSAAAHPADGAAP